MSSIKKRFSLGLAVGLSLGLAGGAAYAGSIADTYTTGDTLTAAKMTNIKTAVGDNDTRITNLQGNAGSGTCVTNNASDEMVRVGPICVDKHRASIWPSTAAGGTQVTSLAGCNANGTGAGCAGIVAQSRPTVTPIDGDSITWAQAQRACSNAGKRLLTPGEWMAAYSSGLAPSMATADKEDYVDAVGNGGASAKLLGGYMGPTSGAAGVEFDTSALTYDLVAGVSNIFGFRCAR